MTAATKPLFTCLLNLYQCLLNTTPSFYEAFWTSVSITASLSLRACCRWKQISKCLAIMISSIILTAEREMRPLSWWQIVCMDISGSSFSDSGSVWANCPLSCSRWTGSRNRPSDHFESLGCRLELKKIPQLNNWGLLVPEPWQTHPHLCVLKVHNVCTNTDLQKLTHQVKLKVNASYFALTSILINPYIHSLSLLFFVFHVYTHTHTNIY